MTPPNQTSRALLPGGAYRQVKRCGGVINFYLILPHGPFYYNLCRYSCVNTSLHDVPCPAEPEHHGRRDLRSYTTYISPIFNKYCEHTHLRIIAILNNHTFHRYVKYRPPSSRTAESRPELHIKNIYYKILYKVAIHMHYKKSYLRN